MAASHLRLDPLLGELAHELLLDLGDHIAVARFERGEPFADDAKGFRVEFAERQVFHLLAHLVHAHAAGERRIDVERLFGGAPARLGRHEVERAHVVQAVGELDQQHAHIGGDREQELAQVLGLLRLARDEVELLQLGEAVDQRADLRAERLVDLGARRLGVLDGVVQQRRHDGRVVELQVGQDRGDFERMGKVGIAGGARLRAVRLHGVDIGAVEQVLVGVGIVVLDLLDQVVLPHHVRPAALLRLLGLDGRDDGRRRLNRALRGALVLRTRQIGLRARHEVFPDAAMWSPRRVQKDITGHRKRAKAFAGRLPKDERPGHCRAVASSNR